MSLRLLLIALGYGLLVGCASGPQFAVDTINTDLKPQAVVQDDSIGQQVLWGGRIIQVRPGAGDTIVELVSFPLQRNQKPDISSSSSGRFLVRYRGYLEPEDYQSERLLTVVGAVAEIRTGKVGEAEYRYPLIDVDNLYLWPEQRSSAEPQVHFGLGVGIGR